jgi:hypothetical protein
MARAHTDRSTGPSTKEAIVTAARRFALHGPDGVSLRRTGTEAGCAMNTAVQYHFGTTLRASKRPARRSTLHAVE